MEPSDAFLFLVPIYVCCLAEHCNSRFTVKLQKCFAFGKTSLDFYIFWDASEQITTFGRTIPLK